MNGKRLYRCRQDRQLAGVAGGMAEYFGVDPTVIRILWILSVFLGGFTILLYIVMAIIVPLEPAGWPGPNGAFAGANAGFAGPNAGFAGPNAAAATRSSAGEVDPATGEAGTGPDAPEGAGWTPASGGAGPVPHWAQPGAWNAGIGWTPGPAHDREPRTGSASLVFGILLVVFGTIALLGPVFPGWLAGVHLGPAFLVALGVGLLVVSLRRPAADR